MVAHNSGSASKDYLETKMDTTGTEQSSYRLHLRNENGERMASTVPTLVLENLTSFLQSSRESPKSPAHPFYHEAVPSNKQIEWTYSQHRFSSSRSPELLRMKAGELIDQEKCDANLAYCVDQPSRLVRIECLKTGCKCVLKQESALALKIVCGVSLIHGTWSGLQQQASHISRHLPPNRFPSNSGQSSPCQAPQGQSSTPISNFKDQIPLIFTSCSPFWFELVKQQYNTFQGSDSPSWSSGLSLWRSRPAMFLLRRQTKCVLSVSSNGPRDPVTLDLDNVVYLHPGTVLRLIDCKSCRLVSKTNPHCPPTSSFLQCEIVGSRSLAKYASLANNIPPDDALYWFASGPRLVYLPLDDKTVSFHPIATPPYNSRQNKNAGWGYSGAHSVLTLLSHFTFPLTVRPVMEHSLANWLTSICVKEGNAGLNLTSCYHGDLVFLEPINDCRPIEVDGSNKKSSMAGGNSRFFVVTAEMLSQHRFILATPHSTQLYSSELKTHASRVAHFLAAFHPACGLNYLLKYLEDVTHCSSIGPSHRTLTETLGPLGGESTVASHTAVSSIAASMQLHLDNEERSGSPDSHALYDDLDDIYHYVRTGRLPSKHGGLTSLSGGMLRSCSAAPGPAARTMTHQNHPIPYVLPPESTFHLGNNIAIVQQQQRRQQQQPPPPPRRRIATPTRAYAYPSPSKLVLKSDIPSPLPFKSPNRRQLAYVDCTRFRSTEQPHSGQPPPSYSILNFSSMNERTNSSPDTGLGGDSGQSGQSLAVSKATTSIVRSSCHQLITFCESGVTNESEVANRMRSPQPLYPNLRRLTVNLNKCIL